MCALIVEICARSCAGAASILQLGMVVNWIPPCKIGGTIHITALLEFGKVSPMISFQPRNAMEQ